MFDKYRTRLLFCSSLALAGASCGKSQDSPRAAVAAAVASSVARSEPAPRGTWRLAPYTELEQTLLWASHVLIRHGESEPGRVPFNVWPWRVDFPPATRSREEARVLAEQVAEQARAEPQRFTELVTRYSEDLTTRDHAGALGGLTLSHYMGRPEVLDALAATAPGGVSSVLETGYGFHVLQRRPPPPEQIVSGEHIVIGYAGAAWLEQMGAPPPQRGRDEALQLARQVYEQARSAPEHFSELVARHSEHPDRARGGDLGSWSTRERNSSAREIELLARLRVGEVGEPLDSPAGFQILRRVADRPRKQFAMRAVTLQFEPGAPDEDPSSQASVLVRARQLARELSADPSRFAAAQRELCCEEPRQWLEGNDEPGMLTAALERLEVGQIADEPVRDFVLYAIPMRIAPELLRPEEFRFDVPAPAHVDLVDVVRRTAYSGTFAQEMVHETLGGAREELQLAAGEWSALEGMLAQLSSSDDPEQRVALYRAFVRDAGTLLGEQRLARALELLTERFDSFYMGG